jgi:hypothetical protein
MFSFLVRNNTLTDEYKHSGQHRLGNGSRRFDWFRINKNDRRIRTSTLLFSLDHNEQNPYEIETDLSMTRLSVPNVSVLGDIRNEELISETLERYRPNTIHHAAAFKHVPLMERNPIAAI